MDQDQSQTFFLLSPNAMGFVPTFLMQVVMLMTLLTWKEKSRATWLIIGWQGSLCVMTASFLAGHSIYAPLSGYLYWIGGITFAWLAISLAIQLAYHFPHLLYPRESRFVLVLSLGLWGVLLALMGLEALSGPQSMDYAFDAFFYGFLSTANLPISSAQLFDMLYPVAFFWPAVIWLRQTVHLSQQATDPPSPPRWSWLRPAQWRGVAGALWSPRSRDARTARMMGLFFSMSLLSVLAVMLEERGFVPVGSFPASFLIAEAAFVLVYLDYSPEPTTFKVKLVGISLVTTMVLLGLLAPMLLTWAQQFYHEARQDEGEMITYLLAHDLTDRMPTEVVYVASRPATGGLFAPSYQVLFSRTPAVQSRMLTLQDARLRAMGRHDLAASWRHFTRVHPWLNKQFPEVPTYQQLERLTIPAGVVAYRGHTAPPEHHFIRYTFQLDAQTLVEVGYRYPAYRQMLHARAMPLVWLNLSTVAFFLLLVPRFIQVSLVQPLTALQEGIRCVEAGDLHTTVPVHVTDEIGFLTGAFNRMVASLQVAQTALLHEIAIRQQKEHELIALTNTLELRVADRTRALAALYEVSALVGQAPDQETVARQSLPRILAAVQGDMGLLYLAAEPVEAAALPVAAALRLVASQGVPTPLLASLCSLPGGCGTGGTVPVLAHSTPLLVHDLATETSIPPALRQGDYPVMYLVPLCAGGMVYGLLLLLRDTSYTTEEMELASSLADHIGKAAETHALSQQAKHLALLEERQRLARELHDSITQSLYGLVMLTEAGQAQVEENSFPKARYTFGRIGETARQVIKEIRLFIHQLRPSVLDREGLVGAIHLRLAAVEGRADIRTCLLADETLHLSRAVEETFYQIAQEALNNTLRHARATSVAVTLQQRDAHVLLEICDNGCGFVPDAPRTGGMGLENIQARVVALGGTLDIRSKPGQGTTVRVTVPEGGKE
jgi:signal transduction histidine kinase/HAMP domain-containing protein